MDWSIIKQIPSVQEKVDLLYSCLTFAVNLFLPLRKVKVSLTDKPWISVGLKLLIAKGQKALVIHGKSSQVYKALRNRVQRECFMCKKRFYNNKFSSLQQPNSARWWKDIKELGGLTYSGDWISHLISGEITDDASLAQTFSDYKVYKTLCALKTKKSSGPDEIPSVVWKEVAFELFPALADIYNSSLEQFYFPTQLKQAVVVPVPNRRPPKSVENDLRPISLTSSIAKVLEGFSAESLITNVFNKLDNKQFALPGRLTTQALIFFMHTILETLDTCGRYIRIFFLDFSKGFDLVDHNVLLSELNNLGVDPHLVRWIAAFLTNRSQLFRIGNSLSPAIGLNGRTPQVPNSPPALLYSHKWNGS